MKNDLVSVVIPVRNREVLIKKCIEAIKGQTYPAVEIVVVDGNSTDGTVEVAQAMADQVIVFPEKGDHRCAQRNLGVRGAKGVYVLILDSDMELSPEVIKEAVSEMQQGGVSGVVIPEESFGQGYWAQCKKLEKSFYVGVPWMEAARFFRKREFLDIGGYDESLTSGEDWDLSQRMQSRGSLSRTQGYIYHNEGRIGLFETMRKKYYYAQAFARYARTTDAADNLDHQTGIFGRYQLFFSDPKKLFADIELGLGMLFMKTCEFGFGGVGYVIGRMKQKK